MVHSYLLILLNLYTTNVSLYWSVVVPHYNDTLFTELRDLLNYYIRSNSIFPKIPYLIEGLVLNNL